MRQGLSRTVQACPSRGIPHAGRLGSLVRLGQRNRRMAFARIRQADRRGLLLLERAEQAVPDHCMVLMIPVRPRAIS